MQQPQHAMGARHLCAGQRGRQERGGKRRQVLVLHHHRLRLRQIAGKQCHAFRAERGWQGGGQPAPPLGRQGLRLLPGAGAVLQGRRGGNSV
ncbi:hypothetical protein G6F59_017634 [Rhizopus arrhizus]|nr:hypothetical protein G6F59_017634 [Rhizopus arrhizus]